MVDCLVSASVSVIQIVRFCMDSSVNRCWCISQRQLFTNAFTPRAYLRVSLLERIKYAICSLQPGSS